MNDLISRQAAIDALNECRERTERSEEFAGLKIAVGVMRALPSAQPERKKGKWIKKMRITKTKEYVSYDPEWYCANCKTKYEPYMARNVNFCYVCGTDMRGEQDGESKTDT